MLCCCQYKSPLPTIESSLQYNSRRMKMFISCYPVVPLLEIILWIQFKRRKLLYAFSKKYITKTYFLHPLVGLGRLPGLLFVQLPNGPVRKTMTRSREEPWAGFTKASCQCSHCLYRQEVHPENVRNRPHCRNTNGLWDGRPLGHDVCAVIGIEFSDLFQAPAWGSMRKWMKASLFGNSQASVQKGLLPPENWTCHTSPSLW